MRRDEVGKRESERERDCWNKEGERNDWGIGKKEQMKKGRKKS